MVHDLYERMQDTAEFLRKQGVGHADIGIVLGSGLAATEVILEDSIDIPYNRIPHLAHSGSPGHRGVLKYGRIGAAYALVFCGRLHYYEGYDMWQVSYPIRIMQVLGVSRAITTAAAGALNTEYNTGDLVLLSDHLNLMPDNPLRGIVDPRLGLRFPDMTNAYDPEWSEQIASAALTSGLELRRGVYVSLMGPSLETQAECAYLRGIGADLVGMSVVPEVITGVQAGIRMAAVCIVSNIALHPDEDIRADVMEILATADAATPRLIALLTASCS
jgi:purine-nucleoside phosphorylase